MRHAAVLLLVSLALLAADSAPGRTVAAASFSVNSTADAVDASPGDSLCATPEGVCTLRAAIQEANALVGPDSLSLPAGTYGLTTPGRGEDAAATGDLDISDDLTITGAGADATVIDGGGWDGVFHTAGEILVEISGVTIRNGATASFFPLDGLGGWGGGISNDSGVTMTLTGVAISNNWASHGGGGIANGGTLTLLDTVVSGNTGAVAGEASGGGGISSGGTITLIDSVVSGNRSGVSGGGISAGGVVTITNSTVSNNTATAFNGGGISGGGIFTITNSTISGNTAGLGGFSDRGGGGIALAGLATITNTTISGNTAKVSGGGIYIGTAASIELTNVTVSGNSAGAEGGGIYNSPANGSVASVALKNTIVAKSLAGGNCAGAIISNGHNVNTDESCGFSAVGDRSNSDPVLGPLADNGGVTQTHALLSGSAAIDAGDDSACPAADQRGVARPADGNGDGSALCDIGAYEAEGPLRRGDADCDEDVDAIDALFALRRVAGLQPYAACIGAATVDCDLDTDALDALFILRHVAALPVDLPQGCPPIG